MMNAYYQQVPGYEYGDPPPSEQPERVAKSSNLPVRDTIAVDESDESSRDKKRESDKSSKYHRSPPVPRGNIAHPAAVRAAIAEVNRERKQARKRVKQCVVFTYFTSKVIGIMANLLLMAFNIWMVFFRQEDSILISRSRPVMVQDRIQRAYLLLFSLAAVLAELDTPFARETFRAWQKWWFKTPFYVFTAILNGMGDFTLHLRSTLQIICFMLLSCAALSSLILQILVKEVLGKMVARKKRKTKQKSNLKGKLAGHTTNGKDPIKWWQEDGVDSYEASEMDISSVISSEGKSTTNSSKWWEADIESDLHSELDTASVSGYRNALSYSSCMPLVSREGTDREAATKSERAEDRAPSGLTLEQRPPPISSSPTATDDETV